MTLDEHTKVLRHSGRKALVAFLTAGYPDERAFVEMVKAASRAGCDVIEIGIPFSDPIADGPIIQESSTRALEQGITLKRCIELARELSSKITPPLVFMSYINPILRMGIDRFAKDAHSAGVRGVIVPDVPLEESEEVRSVVSEFGLTYIDLLAPTSSDERVGAITSGANGFIYLVSVTGVTGANSPEASDVTRFVARVREKTNLPLYVGFGIASAAQARSACESADGVIIGSALIKMAGSVEASEAPERIEAFLRQVRGAIDEVADSATPVENPERTE